MPDAGGTGHLGDGSLEQRPDLKLLKGNPAEIPQDPHMETEPLHLLG